MPVIYVENKSYEVPAGQNLLHACLGLGFDIPYFCWHPALGSVGACRLCAVKQFKDENDTKGKIVMSCMTPANEGVRISISDPEAVKFRKAVLEWLMLNHPHDCPVCDEGGECHLQDMTLMTGQVYRRYRFKKRTHRNQNIGPYVKHEMNRCIQCYRCVRFYNDYAGGRDFGVFCWHDSVYFGRHKDGALQSQFSGNLVEVCPTGVFTDKTLAEHYTRKWDLQTAPSICVHCGLGCNILPGERYGTLRRILNRYNSEVNGFFICDKGRFGYEFVNSERRIKKALRRGEPVSKESAVAEIAKIIRESKSVIGIGSPRASLESNYALWTLVGAERFYAGVSGAEYETLSAAVDILKNGPVRIASLRDAAKSDAVLVLGEDVSKSAPMLELALRQAALNRPAAIAEKLHIDRWNDSPFRDAIQNEKGPLFIATPDATILDDIASATYRASVDDLVQLGFAVANEIDAESPAVSVLKDDVRVMAKRIADDLKNAQSPLVISGTTCGNSKVLQAAANVAYALQKSGKKPQICFVVPNCNSVGLAMLGGKSLTEAVEAIESGSTDTIVILENDVAPDIAERVFNSAKNVIVIDSLGNETTAKANYVLPAATFAESDGTFVNNEGRAQRFFKVFTPVADIQDGWRWLRDIMIATGELQAGQWENLDAIIADLARDIPDLKPIADASPNAGFRMCGQRIPRQPHRASGRTAVSANIDVREHKLADDLNSPLSFSMEGYLNQPPSPLITRFWSPDWNSVQSVTKYQREIGGPLIGGDPGVRLI
ncbi:MAG: NADH-quinone oxidoreductase subunit NuoG [Sedimentisphaerales bacterium]